jgi:hypothetical protein
MHSRVGLLPPVYRYQREASKFPLILDSALGFCAGGIPLSRRTLWVDQDATRFEVLRARCLLKTGTEQHKIQVTMANVSVDCVDRAEFRSVNRRHVCHVKPRDRIRDLTQAHSPATFCLDPSIKFTKP